MPAVEIVGQFQPPLGAVVVKQRGDYLGLEIITRQFRAAVRRGDGSNAAIPEGQDGRAFFGDFAGEERNGAGSDFNPVFRQPIDADGRRPAAFGIKGSA